MSTQDPKNKDTYVWNASGINEKQKKFEVVNVFKNENIYLLDMYETKMV